jgi:retinol dehydrogenase 12
MLPVIIAVLTGALLLALLSMNLSSWTRVVLLGSANRGAGVDFVPERDMPSLEGKVILITGGAGDLGRQMVMDLAKRGPARIYVTDLPREDGGEGLLGEMRKEVPDARLSYMGIDLASFESIKRAAAEFQAKETRLDICILNAGIMTVKPGKTAEGFEMVFGINYMGHALLARLLMPTMLRTAETKGSDVRLVVTSSEGHNMAPKGGIDFDTLKTDGSSLVSLCLGCA